MTSYRPALAGLRVLELGSSVAGPAAARTLADLGAEVIKVEPPEGDTLRSWGPPAPDGTSWWFKSHNRNKRFLSLDLREEADRAVVHALLPTCDVLLENFRPGRMDAWGLGYDALHAKYPQLVYASISGFGQDGPYRDRVGFGNIAESMSGIRFVTGFPDRPPVRVGLSLADELAALSCVVGIQAALLARARDGAGDHVDVSLLEACAALTQGQVPEFDALGVVRERSGNLHASLAPSSIYPTRDGRWFAIGANADGIFRRFTAVMGMPELADDARFCDNRARTKHAVELDELIAAWSVHHDAHELDAMFAAAGVPAGGVYSVRDLAGDAQVQARDLIRHIDDDAGHRVATVAPVPRMREHPFVLDHAGGRIGADNAAVFAELGMTRG